MDKINFIKNKNIVIGKNAVFELLKNNDSSSIDKIYIDQNIKDKFLYKIQNAAKNKKIPVKNAEKQKLENISGMKNHQGIVALIAEREYCSIENIINFAKEKNEDPFIIIADSITDPHNLGAIIRTADAAGVHGIIIPKYNSAGVSGIVSKTSAGASAHVNVAKVSNIVNTIRDLKKYGLWIYGADMDGKNYFNQSFKGPCAIVVGGEDKGISRLTRENCDFLVSIPMYGGVNSLNASVAAALMMYRVVQDRSI